MTDTKTQGGMPREIHASAIWDAEIFSWQKQEKSYTTKYIRADLAPNGDAVRRAVEYLDTFVNDVLNTREIRSTQAQARVAIRTVREALRALEQGDG